MNPALKIGLHMAEMGLMMAAAENPQVLLPEVPILKKVRNQINDVLVILDPEEAAQAQRAVSEHSEMVQNLKGQLSAQAVEINQLKEELYAAKNPPAPAPEIPPQQ